MHSLRTLAALVALSLIGVTACSDTADAPTAPLRTPPTAPNRLTAYSNSYPSDADWAAMGGSNPLVTADMPTGSWSADGKTWTATGTVSFQYINSMNASLSARIVSSTTNQTLAENTFTTTPYKEFQPVLNRQTRALSVSVSAGTDCDITARADLTVEGSLTLLDSYWRTVTVYAMPSSRTAADISRPRCKQTKSDSAYVAPACKGQLVYAPGTCPTGSSGGGALTGGGSACQWWVRRVYVSYDGGRTWFLESETMFQRC